MEFFILLVVIVLLFTSYVMIVNVGVRLLRALYWITAEEERFSGLASPRRFLVWQAFEPLRAQRAQGTNSPMALALYHKG